MSYGRGTFDGFASYQGSSSGSTNDPGKLAQRIGNSLQKISQNVTQLERQVKLIGTPQDNEQVRDRVHQITQETNQLAKDANKDMQTLAKLPLPSDPSQQRMLKTQKERLTEQFSNVLKNFQTTQRSAAEKEKTSLSRARAASSSSYSPYTDEKPKEQFSEPGYSQTAQVLQMENDVDLEMIRERESAIKQLESDIMDVNQIFKDLGMLVHEQGEVLDSIEANVESTQIHVEEGTKQLSQARQYQSKARRKKCCLIIVLLVVLAIVGIILAIVFGSNTEKVQEETVHPCDNLADHYFRDCFNHLACFSVTMATNHHAYCVYLLAAEEQNVSGPNKLPAAKLISKVKPHCFEFRKYCFYLFYPRKQSLEGYTGISLWVQRLVCWLVCQRNFVRTTPPTLLDRYSSYLEQVFIGTLTCARRKFHENRNNPSSVMAHGLTNNACLDNFSFIYHPICLAQVCIRTCRCARHKFHENGTDTFRVMAPGLRKKCLSGLCTTSPSVIVRFASYLAQVCTVDVQDANFMKI